MSSGVHSPYYLAWMDSCLQETLLPGSPWTKVLIILYVPVNFVAVLSLLLIAPAIDVIVYLLLALKTT